MIGDGSEIDVLVVNIEKVENSLVIFLGSMIDPNIKKPALNVVVILT